MHVGAVYLALLYLALLYILLRILALWKFLKKVKKLPTVTCPPIIGHPGLLLGVPQNKIVDFIIDVFNEAPPLCLIWMGPIPMLVITRAEHIETVLSSVKHIKKPFFYSFIEPWLGTGLLLSKGAKWHSRRKLLTPAFHFKILESFVDVFAEKSQILVKKLEKEVGSESFDITPYISLCALDVICETAMGTKINAQEMGQKSEHVNVVTRLTEEFTRRMLSPWIYPDFIYFLTPLGRRYRKDVKTVHNLTNMVIRERRQLYEENKNQEDKEDDTYLGKKRRLTFLDILLECTANDKKFSIEDIREEVDTFMFEGHDTTKSAINFAIKMLACHPDIQKDAYEELEGIFHGSDRAPDSTDLSEMKYLERVIKETLRLFPSVPIIGRIAAEDLEIDGHIVPAGTLVTIGIFMTHRQGDIYPDPLTFNPDHFLPEKIINRHPYAYVPFSAGPRNCIGQKFALMEMKMTLSYVLRHYELHSVGKDNISFETNLILTSIDGIHIKISKRKPTEIK